MSKKTRNIFDIILYILLIYFLSFGIGKFLLSSFEITQNMYCNYAVENGDYEDNNTGRLQCSVDYLQKILEEENEKEKNN